MANEEKTPIAQSFNIEPIVSREEFKKFLLWALPEYNKRFKDDKFKKDLKVLETLKYRVHLKEDTIKGAYFTINEKGVPEIENDTKDYDIAWIKASGFVFKNSEEYKLLKRWLEDDK